MERETELGSGDVVAEAEAKDPQQILLERVIGNEVVSKTLSSFLSLADLKSLSEAAKGFLKFARDSKDFADRVVFPICKETVSLDKFLAETEYPWKTVEVDCSLPDLKNLLALITDILEGVEDLRVQHRRLDKMADDVVPYFLTGLIHRTPNLKSLRIDSIFLEQVLHDVLSDTLVQERLQGLKEFEITNGRKNDGTHYLSSEEGEEVDVPFPRNFYQLSLLPLKLETLRLGKICTLQEEESGHVEFIPNLLEANKGTLTELSIGMCQVFYRPEMESIRLPRLRKLELTAYGKSAPVVTTFLTNQPNLTSLKITMKNFFPIQLLRAIQGKSRNLEVFHISTKKFATSVDDRTPPTIDWSWLSNITGLKEFAITRPFNEDGNDAGGADLRLTYHQKEGTGATFLLALPPSVKRLKLRGLTDFWFDCRENKTLSAPERIAFLHKYQDLTQLSLVRCSETFLDDEFLQEVIKSCIKLRKLEITHGGELTDYGITGMNAGVQTGVSLMSLKGLLDLVIKGCNYIHIGGILEAVKFPFLKNFEYLTCFAVSQADIKTIAEQNPSLERIAVPISELDEYDETGFDSFKKELKTINKRICTLVSLDDDRWLAEDSDSDADEAPEEFWGAGGSDISGGPPDYDDMLDNFDDEYDDDDYDEDDFDYV